MKWKRSDWHWLWLERWIARACIDICIYYTRFDDADADSDADVMNTFAKKHMECRQLFIVHWLHHHHHSFYTLLFCLPSRFPSNKFTYNFFHIHHLVARLKRDFCHWLGSYASTAAVRGVDFFELFCLHRLDQESKNESWKFIHKRRSIAVQTNFCRLNKIKMYNTKNLICMH